MSSLISVIMPVYNTAEYISRSLLSVLNQSYKNLELIVVNDGSTDDSLNIVENYSKSYKNVKILSLDSNHGAGYARNQGLAVAQGNIIGFIDSDDWLDSNFYSTLIDNMQKYQSDISVSGIINEYRSKKESNVRYLYKYENILSSDYAIELLARIFNTDIYLTPIVNNKIYKRSLFCDNQLNFMDKSYYEDDILTLWLFYFANKIGVSSLTNYHYLQRESSIMHTFTNKHIDDLFEAFKKLKLDIKANNAIKLESVYYKYFEKNFSALLQNLFTRENNVTLQRKYLNRIITALKNNFDETEIIDAIGMDVIKRLYL